MVNNNLSDTADRYLASTPEVKICVECGKEVTLFIRSGGEIHCDDCYTAPEQPGLAELTDRYINEGCDEDGAFLQACHDKGIQPKHWRSQY